MIPAQPSRQHRHRSVVLLGLGFLLGLGVLFGWLRKHGSEVSAGGTGEVRRLAVLPFDNLGAADDEYFADGVTDEIRGKLSAIPGLQVTASRSAAEYKKSTKDLAHDRPGAGSGLPAGREGPVGEGRRRAEPGAGEPGADPGARPARPAGSSRSTPTSPTSSRCRRTSRDAWPRRSTWRSAPARSRPLAERPTREPAGVRRLPQGRGGLERCGGHRSPHHAPSAGLLRSGHRARFQLRGGMVQALPGPFDSVREQCPGPGDGENRIGVGRTGAGPGAGAPGGLSRARHVLPPRLAGQWAAGPRTGSTRPQAGTGRCGPPRRRRPGTTADGALGRGSRSAHQSGGPGPQVGHYGVTPHPEPAVSPALR